MEKTGNKTGSMEIKDGRITFGNLIFYHLESNNSFQIEQLMGFDALILDARDLDYARLIIKRIRTHYNPEFYLKPLFLLNLKSTKDPLVNHLHDGIIYSFDQVPELAEIVQQIFLLTTQLDYNLPNSFEAQTIKKVFNYMYTRQLKSLRPYVDVNSIIGYTYPELSVSFDDREEAQTLDILTWAEKEGLIWPDFYERVYLCNHCSSGFLSYREVCPHCQSANAKSEDLVHHFPCAHIAPISDFKNGIDNTLSCPKCSKTLRHIGVDYDKPSVVNHCNNCDSNFQDFYIKAKCMACEQDTEVQYLVPKSIYLYKLTKKGRSAAVNGLFTAAQEVDDVFGTLRPEMLKVMLHYELERMKRSNNYQSSLAIFHFENIYELYNRIGPKMRKSLVGELMNLVRENIRPSDYIGLESAATFYICFVDADEAAANATTEHIYRALRSAISKNFDNFDASVRYKTTALHFSKPAEIQMQELSKELFN